jgi:hypothetical protein
MNRSGRGLLLAALVLLGASPAQAQCTKDIDCKGNRICQQGACVEAAQPMAAPPAAPQPQPVVQASSPGLPPRTDHHFRRGYGSIAALLVPHTWWGSYHGGTADEGFDAGLHVSGFAALTQRTHLGGYLSWYDLHDLQLDAVHLVGLGIALKAGGVVGDRVWLGFALDIGLLILSGPQTLYGLQLFPRFQVEVAAVDVGGFRLAPFAALGSMGMPVGDISRDVLGWMTVAQLLIGASFGS